MAEKEAAVLRFDLNDTGLCCFRASAGSTLGLRDGVGEGL